jgi:glutamine amidotransferase PdxT
VALAFHPELTSDRRAHAWFVNEVVLAGRRPGKTS